MTRTADILWTLIYHTESNAAFRWMWWLCICIAFMAVGGTFVGALYIGGGGLTAIYVALAPGRFLHFRNAEKTVTLIIGLLAATSVASSLINPHPAESLGKSSFLLGIALTVPLMLVLPTFAQPHWRRRILDSMSAGGVIAGCFAAAWLSGATGRLEAATGNPLIFGHLCGVLAVANFVLIGYRAGAAKAIPAAGFIGATLAVIMSGSRGPLAAELTVCAALAVYLLLSNSKMGWGSKLLVLYATLVAVVAVYVTLDYFEAFSFMRYRLMLLVDEIFGTQTLGDDVSARVRLDMLVSGTQAILDRPLLGYGRQNVLTAASAFHPEGQFRFTHLHNALLTEAVASGLVGAALMVGYMMSPIILTLRADSCVRRIALVLVGFTMLGDLLNIGMPHDIKMAWFGTWIAALNTLALTPVKAVAPPRLTLREEFRAYWRKSGPGASANAAQAVRARD